MFLNTLQVRAIAKLCTAKAAHTYTDKTSDINTKRRSVVYCFYSNKDADAMQKHLQDTFALAGVANKVKRTGNEGNYNTYTHGGQYVRVIADLA